MSGVNLSGVIGRLSIYINLPFYLFIYLLEKFV